MDFANMTMSDSQGTLKALSDQAGIRYQYVYDYGNLLFTIVNSLQKWLAFPLQEKKCENYQN